MLNLQIKKKKKLLQKWPLFIFLHITTHSHQSDTQCVDVCVCVCVFCDDTGLNNLFSIWYVIINYYYSFFYPPPPPLSSLPSLYYDYHYYSDDFNFLLTIEMEMSQINKMIFLGMSYTYILIVLFIYTLMIIARTTVIQWSWRQLYSYMPFVCSLVN